MIRKIIISEPIVVLVLCSATIALPIVAYLLGFVVPLSIYFLRGRVYVHCSSFIIKDKSLVLFSKIVQSEMLTFF